MAIRLGEKVFHPGHGWVSTYESCDCDGCQEKQKEGE